MACILSVGLIIAGCGPSLKLRPHDSVVGPYRIAWIENLPGYPQTAPMAAWDTIALMREYHVRSGVLPDAKLVAANVTDGVTPLHHAVGAFRTQDVFKKREAQAVIDSESRAAFLAHDPSAHVALLQGVQIKPFDANTGSFTVCMTALCAGSATWVAPIRASDYRLEVRNMPGQMTWKPQSEAVARQIEAGAAQQFPRGMNVRLIVALDKEVQSDLVLRGTLVAVAIYRRESLGDPLQFEPQRLIAVEAVEISSASSTPPIGEDSPNRAQPDKIHVPDVIATEIDGYARVCSRSQAIQRQSGWLRSADIDGDGEADYVLDGTKVDCPGASIWGNGGSPITVFLQRRGRFVKAFEQAVGEMRLAESRGRTELQVQVGGPLCGQRVTPAMRRSQMLPCWRPVKWSRGQQKLMLAPIERVEPYSPAH